MLSAVPNDEIKLTNPSFVPNADGSMLIVKSCNNSLLFVKSCDICLCSGSKKVVDTPIVWNFVRIINILILFRLLRIIPNIKVRNSAEAKLLDGLILCLNRPG